MAFANVENDREDLHSLIIFYSPVPGTPWSEPVALSNSLIENTKWLTFTSDCLKGAVEVFYKVAVTIWVVESAPTKTYY